MRVGILELGLWGATAPWVLLRDIACAGEHRRNSLCVTWRKVRRLGTPTKGPCRTAWRDLHSPRVHRNGLAAGDEPHYTVWPPSTTRACPTTKAAASEHSQTTAAAISSGLPIRPIGSCAITLSRPSGVPR